MLEPIRPPTNRSEGSEPSEPKRLVPWKRGPEILLVEDDVELRRLIAGALRRDGYHVVECGDGRAALDRLGEALFDGCSERLPALIVSDVRLPGFDGFDILEAVHAALAHVPMVLLPAFPDEQVYRRAFALGARNVLAKPFDVAELRAVVWTTLEPDPSARGQHAR